MTNLKHKFFNFYQKLIFFFSAYIRFKLDGIEHYENIKEKDGILPYGQSGRQSIKYKLVKKMVPGQPEIFPSEVLTTIERCTLHQAISNTIMKQNSRDINILCQEIGQKLTGNFYI